MDKVLGFSEIDKIIPHLKYKRVALDASFLIKVFFDHLHNHELCKGLIKKFQENHIILIANATVKSELLDFSRKANLTQLFFKEIDAHGLKFTGPTRDLIRKIKENKEKLFKHEKKDQVLSNSELDQIRNQVMGDSELKEIRENIFQRQGISGASKWSKLCGIYLSGRIKKNLEDMSRFSVRYMSYDSLKDEALLEDGRILEWQDAVKICESSGVGFWDSMLINFTETAKVDMIVSLDSDIAYAYAACELLTKSVLTTDKIKENISALRL